VNARAFLRPRRGVAEPVEQFHLLFAVPSHLVVLRQVEHELLDPGAQLVGEVRRRRAYECIDLRLRHLGLRHGQKPTL
jgi:hypothetical protein